MLLSSLEGAAVSSIKIKGVQHEFSPLKGAMEDVTDIVLNVKSLVVKMEGDEPKTMRLAARGPGEVTADMIQADTAVTILNKDLVIVTLTDAVDFEMEFVREQEPGLRPRERAVQQGRRAGNRAHSVDAIYSPVQRVRYKIEETRVGQRTNYDKLTMEVWTNGTRHARDGDGGSREDHAQAPQPLVQYFDIGEERVSEVAAQAAMVDEDLIRKLNMNISELELSVRASNCLESARIETVGQLVTQNDADLLKLRSFGRTSLREVKRKLQDLNLDLGVQLPEGYPVAPVQYPAN